MNAIEKLLTWAFGWKYDGKEKILVEIQHLNTYDRTAVTLGTEISVNYSKYPLEIQRPLVGSTTIDHACRICNAPLKIKIQSKSSLTKNIKLSGIVASISFLLLVLVLTFLNNPGSFSLYLILVILLGLLGSFSLLVLGDTLSKEYKNKGVDDKICDPTLVAGREIYKHTIDQSPKT